MGPEKDDGTILSENVSEQPVKQENVSMNRVFPHPILYNPMGSEVLNWPTYPISPIIYAPQKRYRKGKWTEEEEQFTKALIHAFNEGYLTIPVGTTLRTFLSDKLNCDPMRITKKFAGSSSIGKQIYTSVENLDQEECTRVQNNLKELEQNFIAKITVHHPAVQTFPPVNDYPSVFPHYNFVPGITPIITPSGILNPAMFPEFALGLTSSIIPVPIAMPPPSQESSSSSLNPDFNLYLAQCQMHSLAQARAFALGQAHANESLAVEQAQKIDYSKTYSNVKQQIYNNADHVSNNSLSHESKNSSSSTFNQQEQSPVKKLKDNEKSEPNATDLLLNFYLASSTKPPENLPTQEDANQTTNCVEGLPTLPSENKQKLPGSDSTSSESSFQCSERPASDNEESNSKEGSSSPDFGETSSDGDSTENKATETKIKEPNSPHPTEMSKPLVSSSKKLTRSASKKSRIS